MKDKVPILFDGTKGISDNRVVKDVYEAKDNNENFEDVIFGLILLIGFVD